MKNLAGIERSIVNVHVLSELQEAKIPHFKIDPSGKREVDATFVGCLYLDGCVIDFKRAWYYWVVESSIPFPLKDILSFNSLWGADARIWGFVGGRSNQEIQEDYAQEDFDCVKFWHIDTPESFSAFAEMAQQVFGKK